MADILAGLTPEQREAATHREGPLLIIAGAGSGKTRTVTRRIAHLSSTGVDPASILAITFTNKAAGEMRERVASLLPDLPSRELPTVSTFHAFAVKVLRRFAKRLGISPRFSILSPADRLSLVREAMVSAMVDVKRFRVQVVSERIGRVKESLDEEGFFARAGNDLDRATAKVLPIYRELQRRRGALDFDDLVAEVVLLCEREPEVHETLLAEIRYVLVDEYQDTNHAQYRLANLMAGERKNLAVCGDPDQSIYAWRGADMGNILRFEEDYPGAKVVLLERNYRSTARILEAANTLIKCNEERREKQLLPNGEDGGLIDVVACGDAEMEAESIARRIKKLVEQEGVPPREIAVAFRGKIHAPGYEDALVRHGVPCTVVGATSFFERREIKDAMAYVRLGINPKDDLAALRALRLGCRGVGKKTVDRLFEEQRRRGVSIVEACEGARKIAGLIPAKRSVLEGFGRLVRALEADAKGSLESLVGSSIARAGIVESLDAAKDPSAENRLKNLDKLSKAARQADKRGRGRGDPQEFLDRLALIDSQDREDETPDRVSLTTIHASKGLEFDVVFVAGLEQGLFPHHRSVEEGMLEEERRLAYVALTRARKRLILTYATNRAARTAALSRRTPSQFLYELPPELLWDPVFKERMVLPERVDPKAAEPAPKPEARARSEETKIQRPLLLGTKPKGGKAPLWARGLAATRRT